METDKKSQVMSDELLENVTRDYIESQPEEMKEVVFSWWGEESTLLGISFFFEKALRMQENIDGPEDLHNPYRRDAGRNDPFPCGSGRKIKHCHGRNH